MTTQSIKVATEAMSSIGRDQIPERKRITRWIKGGWVGAVAGALFITVEMFLFAATGEGSLWEPVRLSASIAMGSRVVATSAPFTFDIFFIGMLVHFVLSILYAVILGMIIRNRQPGAAVLVGAIFGLALYGLHFYGLAMVYPWVANARGWIAVAAHVLFGVSAAWMYNHLHVRELMREAGLSR